MADAGNLSSQGQGICKHPSHSSPLPVTVTFTQGEDTYLIDGKPALTLNSKGIGSCGHPATPKTASDKMFANGSGLHRVGDTGELPGGGTYTLITGVSTFQAG